MSCQSDDGQSLETVLFFELSNNLCSLLLSVNENHQYRVGMNRTEQRRERTIPPMKGILKSIRTICMFRRTISSSTADGEEIQAYIVEVLLDCFKCESTILDNLCLMTGTFEEFERDLLIDDVYQSAKPSELYTVRDNRRGRGLLSSARRTLNEASPPLSEGIRLLASRAGSSALHISWAFVGDSTQLATPKSRQY